MLSRVYPFRDAYKAVSDMVKNSTFSRTSLEDYVHEGSIGNLCNKEIAGLFESRMGSFKNRTAAELADKMMHHVTNGKTALLILRYVFDILNKHIKQIIGICRSS